METNKIRLIQVLLYCIPDLLLCLRGLSKQRHLRRNEGCLEVGKGLNVIPGAVTSLCSTNSHAKALKGVLAHLLQAPGCCAQPEEAVSHI